MAKEEICLVNDRTVKRFSVSYSGPWIHSSFLGARVKLSFAFASVHNASEMALEMWLQASGYYLALWVIH